jgi:glucosamine 6-phosphate synthetase-like amidotransferase/phosphosugar isomerase protein
VALNLLASSGPDEGTLREPTRASHMTALLQLPKQMEQALKASAVMEEVAGRFFNRTDFLFSGPRHQLPDRARGRAEAEGNLLHSRRRATRPAR